MSLTKEHIISSMQDGLLSFPITDMNADGTFNPSTYEQRIEWFVTHGVSAVFIAGGTGEFNSLSAKEYGDIVRIAAQVVNGRVPVLAGAGRPGRAW